MNSPVLEACDTFLTIADLFNYWLTGNKSCEYTHVTTQQLYNPNKQDWDFETMEALGIPNKIFPDVLKPGTKIGNYQKIPVILPACHDTASAVVSVHRTQGILHSSQAEPGVCLGSNWMN